MKHNALLQIKLVNSIKVVEILYNLTLTGATCHTLLTFSFLKLFLNNTTVRSSLCIFTL